MKHQNILRWFQDTAERLGHKPCLKFIKDKTWQSMTWLEVLSNIQAYSESLKKLNVTFEDRISILSLTRYEWTLIDFAILSLGAVVVPIYQSTLPEEAEFILRDSDSKIIFVENLVQLEKILKIKPQLPLLQKIILIDGESSEKDVLSFKEFIKLGQGQASDFGHRIRDIQPQNLATLVYTSGTTGVPKGVILNHRNIVASVESALELFPLNHIVDSLIFLPLAHILGRVAQFVPLARGISLSYAESIDKLAENIQDAKPEFFVGVPRIFEKIYQGVMHSAEASPTKKKIFIWARDVGRDYSDHICAKRSIPFGLSLKYAVAKRLVFNKLLQKLGGRLKYFISGGAPLSPEIARFFHGAGILILEGYGLTETTAAFSSNRIDDFVFGTVGRPGSDSQAKLAADGELLVKGPLVTPGYWKNPKATEEVFDAEGWFKTGDIAVIDSTGRIKITDRKKDIIVTAGGKNVAPQKIENMLKMHPLISQVMVHGDKRKYLSALVTLNPDKVKKIAGQRAIAGKSYSEWIKSPQIYDEVKKIIETENTHLANYETIKRFAIIEKDFTIESGELTPSLKVKRKVVNERYKDVLDKLYRDEAIF